MIIGVKFIIQGGQFVAVALPEETAHKHLQDWLSGELNLRGSKRIGGTCPDGTRWAVDVPSIQAIHTFDVTGTPLAPPEQNHSGQPTGPGFMPRRMF